MRGREAVAGGRSRGGWKTSLGAAVRRRSGLGEPGGTATDAAGPQRPMMPWAPRQEGVERGRGEQLSETSRRDQ